MTNKKVYLKKLKLDAKYLGEPRVALLLGKPGTLSKQEKEWLKSYVSILLLKEKKQAPRNKLSDDFKRSLNGNIYR